VSRVKRSGADALGDDDPIVAPSAARGVDQQIGIDSAMRSGGSHGLRRNQTERAWEEMAA